MKGMLWPQAIAGVVGCARHPTTSRWPLPREGFSSLHVEFLHFSTTQKSFGSLSPTRERGWGVRGIVHMMFKDL
jgi:hypothetical protein